MKPYYEHAGITIYHGDCREVLPSLEPVDLVLTDPPYGLQSWTSTGGNCISSKEADEINQWDIKPSEEVFQAVLRAGKYCIVWGGNYFAGMLGWSCRAPLVWDKGQRGMHFADGEIAWTNFDWGTLRILEYSILSGNTKGCKVHPTQKPVAVMKWCIQQCKYWDIANSIIDPYMGSGTTLIAAKDLGRRAIGIEIEEKYCEIAAKRLSQEVLDFGLK